MRRPSSAMSPAALLISILALVVATSAGTAYAATKIGTKQLKKNAVTSAKIKDKTIQSRDLSAATVQQFTPQAGQRAAGPCLCRRPSCWSDSDHRPQQRIRVGHAQWYRGVLPDLGVRHRHRSLQGRGRGHGGLESVRRKRPGRPLAVDRAGGLPGQFDRRGDLSGHQRGHGAEQRGRVLGRRALEAPYG